VARTALADADLLRIVFVEPAGFELRVEHPGRPNQKVKLLHKGKTVSDAKSPHRVCAAIEYIVEAGIPFDRLGLKVDEPLAFFVEVLQGGQSTDRAPRDGAIALTRPSADFEQIMWDV
jgi:hypothetical protein